LVFQKVPQKLPKLDLYFLCLPHGKSMEIARKALKLPAKVVDLSADFRIQSVPDFEKWYQHPHSDPDLCREAVFGLPEIYRDAIRSSHLVANPGCYPTSVLLPLVPLFKAGFPIVEPLIIDTKSGVSGAGRNPGLKGQFTVVNENFSAYKIGRAHRHIGEIEEKLNYFAQNPIEIIFTPHLLPVNRGILSTIYVHFSVPVSEEAIRKAWDAQYHNEPFIKILASGQSPELIHVRYSNRCDMGVHTVNNGKLAILISCIDNLVKGASGQAIQNMNLLFGWPEILGLPVEGVVC
jgi:N-acetyl-gamma-glutamyl-phosphate reductase